MRKLRAVLVSAFLLCTAGIKTVDAREYTYTDVQQSLAATMSVWQSTAPEGTTFNFSTNGNDMILKTTFRGTEYEAHVIYDNGVFNFVSDRSAVKTENDFVKSYYDNHNITFLLVSLLRMYDQETRDSVKDIVINSSLSMEDFSLERDGLTASLMSSNIKEVTVPTGEKLEAEGFLKSISIDINHPNFIKFVIDNNGSLVFQSKVEKKKPILTLSYITEDSITVEVSNIDLSRPRKLYRKVEGGEFELLSTGSGVGSYVDKNLEPDTIYSYKVVSEDNVESDVTSARTLKRAAVEEPEPDPKPTVTIPKISLSNVGMTSITINIDAPGSSTCDIYRAREEGAFEMIKSGVACNKAYVDDKVYANTSYSYKVMNDKGYFSEEVGAKTKPKVLSVLPDNPKTGILTYGLLTVVLSLGCFAGLKMLGKRNVFRKL